MRKIFLFAMMAFAISCTSVDAGHQGVKIDFGGKTDMGETYGEGFYPGISWLWNDMVQYNVQEQTSVFKFEFNDTTAIPMAIEIAVDYKYMPEKVNHIHKFIKNPEIKLEKTVKSASKEVVTMFRAVDLNLEKRRIAEERISSQLALELPEFYLEFVRLQITDVDIPAEIANAAKQNARQLELTKLAGKKAETAKNELDEARFKAQSAQLLSEPALLKLRELENEKLMIEGYNKHGKSFFGEHNVFGTTPSILLSK